MFVQIILFLSLAIISIHGMEETTPLIKDIIIDIPNSSLVNKHLQLSQIPLLPLKNNKIMQSSKNDFYEQNLHTSTLYNLMLLPIELQEKIIKTFIQINSKKQDVPDKIQHATQVFLQTPFLFAMQQYHRAQKVCNQYSHIEKLNIQFIDEFLKITKNVHLNEIISIESRTTSDNNTSTIKEILIVGCPIAILCVIILIGSIKEALVILN